MEDKAKIPYDMSFLIQEDLKDVPMRKTAKGFNICCPFCENITSRDKHFKYNIDIYKNVGHCMRCGIGHNVISLHKDLMGFSSNAEAKIDLDKRYKGLPSEAKLKIKNVKVKLEKELSDMLKPCPIEIRDEVYKKLWNELTLSDIHKKDLLDRGLTEGEIYKNYKSVPNTGFNYLAQKCLDDKTTSYLFKNKMGVPGFYNIFNKDARRFVELDSGYLIRVFDENKRISGFQIRYDKPVEGIKKKTSWAKYKWLTSSGLNEGCSISGCENLHHAGDFSVTPKVLILTEGVLKSDIASILWSKIKGSCKQRAVLGLVGVNNYGNLKDELLSLKAKGLEKVALAIDMDYRTKPQVKKAMEKIESIIKECDLKLLTLVWDEEKGKGIDDYLLYLLQNKTS